MASSDEDSGSGDTREFATPDDEIRYLKSIVSELESRNKEQTFTLENITEEVRLFTEEKEDAIERLKEKNNQQSTQLAVLENEKQDLIAELQNSQKLLRTMKGAGEDKEDSRKRMAAELETISIMARGAGKLMQLIGRTPSFDINDLQQRRIGQTSMEKWAEEQKRLWSLINDTYEEKMDLHEQIVQKDRQIEDLKAKLKEQQESFAKNEETVKKSAEYRIKQLEDDLSNLEDEVEDLKEENQDLKEYSVKARQLERDYEKLQDENKTLKVQLQEKEEKRTVEQNRNNVQNLEEDVEKLSGQLEKSQKQTKQLEKEIKDLKASLDEADKEFDQSEAGFLSQIAQLKGEIETKDKEIKELVKKNKSLEKELSEADRDIDDLEAEIKKIKQDKTQDEKITSASTGNLPIYSQSISLASASTLTLSNYSPANFLFDGNQIAKLEDQKEQLQSDFNTLQDDIFKINTDKSKMKEERDRLRIENKKIKKELEEALAEIERLKALLKSKDETEKSLQDKLSILPRTTAENEHLKEQVDLLQNEVKASRVKSNELKEKEKRIEELQRKLRLLDQEKNENKALTQQVAVLKKENENLISKTLSMKFEVDDEKLKTLVFHGSEPTNELILKLYYAFKQNLDEIKQKKPDLVNLKSEIWLDMNLRDKGRLFYLFRYNR